MEEKRVTAMFIEEEDEFSEKTNKSTADQKSTGSEFHQNKTQAGGVPSQPIGQAAHNSANPGHSPASKSFPNSPAGTDSRASENLPKTPSPASTPQNPQTPKDRQSQPTRNNAPNKPAKRVRRKKPGPDMPPEEYRKFLTDEIAKEKDNVATGKKRITTLTRELEALDENPDEFMTSKRNLDSHCKILAGVAAITLYNSKSKEFTRENFREALNALLKKSADKKYFDENLHE